MISLFSVKTNLKSKFPQHFFSFKNDNYIDKLSLLTIYSWHPMLPCMEIWKWLNFLLSAILCSWLDFRMLLRKVVIISPCLELGSLIETTFRDGCDLWRQVVTAGLALCGSDSTDDEVLRSKMRSILAFFRTLFN